VSEPNQTKPSYLKPRLTGTLDDYKDFSTYLLVMKDVAISNVFNLSCLSGLHNLAAALTLLKTFLE
jgi:hypothetical protein